MQTQRFFGTLLTLFFFSGLVASTVGYAAGGDNSVRNRIKIQKKSKLNYHETDSNEEFNLERVELLAKKRKALVEDIKRFIRESTSEDQKAELNLRLGGLYMEDYYSNLAKAQSIFEQQTKIYGESDKKKKGRAPTLDNSEALASLDRARAVYRDLLKRYPQHRRRDEMLYFLALSALDKGMTNEGMAYFKQLSDSSPNSRYINDALLQLADHYFENNKFPVAESYYDKIIQKKHVPLLPYAVYKKAWCKYNLQNTPEALKLFKWVIDNEEMQETKGSSVRIRAEALKDITLPFVDLKLINEAVAFFKRHGDPHYRRALETMAALTFEQGEYKSAIYLNETLLALDPNFHMNPGYDIAIVDSYKLSNQDKEAVNRLFSRFPAYLENSNWYELNATKPQNIKEAQQMFEETARKYAFQYHAEGQKTKNDKLYDAAKTLYAKYLDFFPRTPHAPQVRFYLAEILYKQAAYVPAADHYYRVYKDPSAGNLRVDAIRYAMSSLDRQLNIDRKKAGLAEINSKSTSKLSAKDEDSLELLPYSQVEKTFIEISNVYLENFPTTKEAPDALYEQAYLQYVHHDMTPAYKSFWNLIQKYPKHETAYSSGFLVLDILNRLKDYSRLIAACKKFLDTKTYSRASFRTEVATVLRSAELKRITQFEEKKQFKEAADQYIEYTKAYGPQDEALFEKALYNASINYSKANLLMSAVETQEKFLRRFPKSSYRENMFLQVARTYETLATFDKAALYYEQFANQYPQNAQARNALRLAGVYYWGSGNTAKAEGVMLGFLRAFAGTKEATQVEHDLVDVYRASGAKGKLVQLYLNKRAMRGLPLSDYLALTVEVAEVHASANARIPANLMDEAIRVANKNARQIIATPKGAEALSKLHFWVASRKEKSFYSLKLALPQRQLEANLARKLALMKELESDYTQIVKLGSAEWGLASIYRMGAAYRHMAQDVAQAPVPAELTAEQLEMYRGEIAKQMIKPFNEKALAYSISCLDKSQEFNLLTHWTSKCYSLAGELQPERYPVVRTFYLPPVQLALLMPSRAENKIAMGNVKRFAYPYYSAGLFNLAMVDRTPDSEVPSLYDSRFGFGENGGSVPAPTSYRNLADERQSILKSVADSEKPSDLRKGGTFAYLNVLRLTQPQRAVTAILEAIQRDPQDHALHNLLALSYLELNNLPAAKVVWYSLIARGLKSSAIWNNLGVVSTLENNEDAAIVYFTEAAELENPRESLLNLGYIALKYRNGFEAKKHFEKAMTLERDDVTSQIGYAVARLQNRELDAAKEELIDLAKKYKNDPFARLSLGYFLIDIEKENGMAQKILSDYMSRQSAENDLQFRQAVQAARDLATIDSGGAPGSLPTIE